MGASFPRRLGGPTAAAFTRCSLAAPEEVAAAAATAGDGSAAETAATAELITLPDGEGGAILLTNPVGTPRKRAAALAADRLGPLPFALLVSLSSSVPEGDQSILELEDDEDSYCDAMLELSDESSGGKSWDAVGELKRRIAGSFLSAVCGEGQKRGGGRDASFPTTVSFEVSRLEPLARALLGDDDDTPPRVPSAVGFAFGPSSRLDASPAALLLLLLLLPFEKESMRAHCGSRDASEDMSQLSASL